MREGNTSTVFDTQYSGAFQTVRGTQQQCYQYFSISYADLKILTRKVLVSTQQSWNIKASLVAFILDMSFLRLKHGLSIIT